MADAPSTPGARASTTSARSSTMTNAGMGITASSTLKSASSDKRDSPIRTSSGGGNSSPPVKYRRCFSDKSEDMTEAVSKVITFRGKPELLRATRLSLLMRRGATILAQNKGSAETYALSEVVETIDVFISHNWAVSRSKKFLCLALFFNLRLAVMAACVAVAAFAAAASLGYRLVVLEMPVSTTDSNMGTLEHGCGCTLMMTPVLVVFAVLGHEPQRLVRCREPMVFLDKTCIDQVDRAVQLEGIRALGAFLRKSARMMILYTDIYLTKLWTVYEVACFLSMHPANHVTVLPIRQALSFFVGLAIWYVRELLFVLFGSLGGPVVITTASIHVLAVALIAVVLRRWAQAQDAFRKRLATFRLEECTCYWEEDLPIVRQNIALLMRVIGEVASGASDQDALEAFNHFVRRRLSRSLTISIGALGLTYSQIVTVCMCNGMPNAVDTFILGVPSSPAEWMTRYRISWTVYRATWTFGLYPLLIALLSKWCGCYLHLKGGKGFMFVASGAVLVITFAMIVSVSAQALAWTCVMGSHRNAFTTIQIALLAAVTLLAFAAFRGKEQMLEEDEAEEAASGAAAERGVSRPEANTAGGVTAAFTPAGSVEVRAQAAQQAKAKDPRHVEVRQMGGTRGTRRSQLSHAGDEFHGPTLEEWGEACDM